MKTLLVALIAAVTLIPATAGAQTQTASYAQDAAEGLATSPIYVHPDASSALSENDAEELRSQLLDANLGPVFIAVLPEKARNEAGGDPEQLIGLIYQDLQRAGTYAVVAGRTFRALNTEEGTPFSREDVLAVADNAVANAQGGDVATLLGGFVDGLTEVREGGSVPGQSSGGGVGLLLPLLLLGGVGFFALRGVSRRRQQKAQLEEVRQVAEEDLTTFGNDIYELEREFTMPGAHPDARVHYDTAIQEYQQARSAMDHAKQTQDLSAVTESLERGRFEIACTKARLAGRPLPERRPPCFFAPTHGPSTRDVDWAPPGGDPRPVPACEADAQRVERGEEPDTRQISVGGYSRPYWDAPPYFGGYYGGYYGGFGGLGFLQGMMFGSMFGGGWGWGGMGYGGGHGDGGFGDGGNDFGGGGFGDLGGGGFGDFGGGDFGGGDF